MTVTDFVSFKVGYWADYDKKLNKYSVELMSV